MAAERRATIAEVLEKYRETTLAKPQFVRQRESVTKVLTKFKVRELQLN